MSQLTVRDAAIAFGPTTVLSGVSFAVEQGDFLCIVGENGSGKSSLLRAILSLIPLKSGSVEFGEGADRRHIGYLPQKNDSEADFPASVREVVLSGCVNSLGRRFFYSKADRKRADAAIATMDMERFAARPFGVLSGGQKQRVLLARALCAADKMLFLDEPTTGLDPLFTAEFYALAERINRDGGMTIVMVSHDIGFAVRHANRILHVGEHQLFFGTTNDYIKSPVGQRFLRMASDAT